MLTAQKAHTNGNDFLLVEGSQHKPDELVQKIAHRRTGIGCDQVLFYQKKNNIAQVTFFNQDGSKAALCLNGVYALANHLIRQSPISWQIETQHHTFTSHISNDQLHVAFRQEIILDYRPIERLFVERVPTLNRAFFISVGNHHLVLPEANLGTLELPELAKEIETKGLFPDGINISTFKQQNLETQMQTHERGVGLTLGCGSAALAVFAHQLQQHSKHQAITIKQPGGTVVFEKKQENFYMHAHSQVIATVEINS